MHPSCCKQTDTDARHIVSDAGPPPTIIGIGIDIVNVDRLTLALTASDLGPIPAPLTPDEIARCRARPHPAAAFACCFAAKEAVIKALAATDGRGAFWHDIEILGDGHKPPAVVLGGRARTLAAAAGIRRIHLSYDHTRDYAAACAVASR